MRAFDPGLQAHLDSGATTLCTCWRIVRRDGFVFGFTDHDRALGFDGVDYLPESGASGSVLSASADLSVDNGEIEGALSQDALVSDGMTPDDLAAGRYDGAEITIYRVNWAAPQQRVLLRQGVIGEVTREGVAFRAEYRGLTHHLEQTVGRVYQRLCDENLGSAPCGVSLESAAYRTSGAVTALRGDDSFIANGFSGVDDGWFAHGLLQWTSGANAGDKAHIKMQSAGGAVSLWLPAGAAISIGDAFTASAGCDKRFETCRSKFSNAVNFRGFHMMPGNDFVMSYPLRGEANDGGKRR